MKKLFLTCLILMTGILLYAQAPDWLWAVRAGGTQSDAAQLMTIDNQGNQYITGHFNGTTTIGNTSLTSFGDYDIFIAKLDPSGNWLWVRQAGGTQADVGNGIAVDSAGNVYVTGGFVGTATFGPVTLSHNYIEHLFLTKLDGNGNWLWTVEALGEDNEAMGIAFDSDDNVYLTGAYRYTVTFGALPQMTCVGLANVFVAKLDSAGNWLWAVQNTGIGWDVGICMAVDSAGNIYLTGRFQDTATFGTIALTSSGGYDAFIAKLDGNGNWLWAKRAGGTSDDLGWSLVLDDFSNVYVAGAFSNTASFGHITLTSSGSTDIFLTKLDSSGNWLWVIKAGGTSDEIAYSVDLDSENNAYVTGQFGSTAYFGPTVLTSYGSTDVFIAKEDGNGDWNWMWVTQAGGTGSDAGFSLQVGSANELYIMGIFSNTATFGSITLTSSGLLDSFAGKLEADVGNADELTPELPGCSILYNAYPNPFRSGVTTQIKTYVADHETGTLSIYNLKGQCIKTYELSPGTHETSLESKGLASGVYLYKLQTQSVNTVKKLVLIK
jgi:hypothetical protein